YPLFRQPSIYSLTFDEFQSTLGGPGKDFGSMNMEELLKSIWTAEENHQAVVPPSAVFGTLNSGGIQRQGSLTLPRTLSQKTVDEVWRDVLNESIVPKNGTWTGTVNSSEPTLGKVTLQDFLDSIGVAIEDTHHP
ncbi:hypothetical protein M569_00870, partial [Genlisea aurea]